MQVYGCPDTLPAPEFDFNETAQQYDAKCEEHKTKLTEWLRKQGYTGKNTGRTISFSVGDGSAVYMLAEGKKSILLHLPYWDGYQYPDVKFLPKKEILARLAAEEKLQSMFGKR